METESRLRRPPAVYERAEAVWERNSAALAVVAGSQGAAVGRPCDPEATVLGAGKRRSAGRAGRDAGRWGARLATEAAALPPSSSGASATSGSDLIAQ